MKTVFALTFLTVSVVLQSSTLAAAEDQTERRAMLERYVNSDTRSEELQARNRYRHPVDTLLFFDIDPANHTAVEIWPGGQGGWYRSILEPMFAAAGGNYIPVMDESDFPQPVPEVPAGSADRVLVFRAHGFMIYDYPAQQYFDAIYSMLKPGGIFGIVDHRGNEAVPQDPRAVDGYVNQSHVLMLAQNAGFQLLEQAEINANPLDTKNHPDGVYSLPPTLRGSLLRRGLRQQMLEIGESDRMTLKFIKPQN